ncbi:hypothetical protein E2562_039483, partial [Oryza meyeriana var. granulata]
MEFMNHTQNGMPIAEHHDEFQRLAHYSPDDVNTEKKKMVRFVEGLDELIKYKLAGVDYKDMSELLNK